MDLQVSESKDPKERRYKDIGWRYENEIYPFDDLPLHDFWIKPLDAVGRALTGHPRARFFETGDFMIMNGKFRGSRPTLVLYKHYYTRRYLNLDEAGHAYRYVAPRNLYASAWNGRYVSHRDLLEAIDHLQLWLLPWMKPGLEHERRGRSFDEALRLDSRRAA